MAIEMTCQSCQRKLKAREEFAGRKGECPYCGAVILVPQAPEEPVVAEIVRRPENEAPRAEVDQFFEPPRAKPKAEKTRPPMSFRRMFETLLDPRSIQWMLTLGGGLCVLGLIVWLASLKIFENTLVLAAVFGSGSLALLGGGWWVVLQTRFRVAGQALTFLGCIVAPLNLWFYAHVNLLGVEQHLWVGGLVCCLLYIATVYALRDALFVYAVEAGATLTVLLLLAEFGRASDTSCLSVVLMILGLISLHAERSFPVEAEHFTRRRFGLPFFWSGHAQVGVSLLILLGTQGIGYLTGVYDTQEAHKFLNFEWQGNWLTEYYALAGVLWLAGVYAYLYSDLVVRRVGVYTCLAAFCVVMAEVTVAGRWLAGEGWIAVMAVTALAVNLVQWAVPQLNDRVRRVLPPLSFVLGIIPVLMGFLLHVRATSELVAAWNWGYTTGWPFVGVMVLVAVCSRMSAYVFRHAAPAWSATYYFSSAAAVLIAAAGLLRVQDITQWIDQAPWLMAVPILYLFAARLWRGHTAERPLGWVAHAATVVILAHVLVASLEMVEQVVRPIANSRDNLILGLVFAEAAAFYALAAIFRRRSVNLYFATLAACGAVWQFLGYCDVPPAYHTMLYAGLGVALLGFCRVLGIERVPVYQAMDGAKSLATRGRGLAAFQMGNAILVIALLAAALQGLNVILTKPSDERSYLYALSLTTLASLLAVGLAPGGSWRRLYVTATVAVGCVTFIMLSEQLRLSVLQKVEIFSVAAGLLMIGGSYVGRFREISDRPNDLVSAGLWLGSIAATAPLVIAVIYYRFATSELSAIDELALFIVTVFMLVTGYGWQIKATTFFGGVALTLYLIIVVVSLGVRQQLAVGVWLAVGGGLLFALGIALSIYREKLLRLPEQIAKHEGVFRFLTWR